ncbi:MAG: polyphenol oxidase family protein [Deltaproteobacteria bacterium]|nr:polyphenol oxidase family protein [Deltaproteobacteria bacterium]
MPRTSHESPTWSNPQLSLCGFALRGVEPPRAVVCDTQVHGAESHRVYRSPGARWPENPEAGDALWTSDPDLPVAVRVADCVPILLWSPEPRAVGAVHAGWRGTAADIVGASLAFARRELGVEPSRVFAAIGPCISRDRFEVGPEVVQGLKATGLTDEDLRVVLGPRGRPHVDLRSANRALLRQAGVPDAQIEDVGGCTFSEPTRYDSYRRDGERSGRMRATIALAARP